MKNTELPNKLLPFCWHFFKKYPIPLIVFFLSPLLLVLESVAIPYALKMIVDAFAEFDGDRENILTNIAPALWLAAFAWFTLLILIRLQEWWQVYVLPKIEADIRISVTEYLINHSYKYFSDQLSGNLANKIADLPRSIDSLVMNIRWNIIAAFGVVVASLIIIFQVAPIFAFIVLCWLAVEIFIAFSFIGYINVSGKENAEDKSQLSGKIVDSISNIMAVKLFSRRYRELDNIIEFQKTEIKSNSNLKLRICIYRLFMDFPVTIMWPIIGYFLITYWQDEKITTGDLVLVFNILWALMFRMWFLGESLAEIFKDISVSKQALNVIMQPHEIVDSVNAKSLEVYAGEIKFNNVNFNYNEGKNVFNNKNIVIEAGSKVGLVGFSGSGKTTFVNLILRFYDVESGSITIDNQNIADVKQDSLRDNISMIPQDTSLFHRSLMDNIRYGNPNASDVEVIEAARKAHCHDFISKLPEAYNTMVGERGVKLSGGQRQRIAIARAILKNAPILLLDEATSALDSLTEQDIQDSLYDLMNNRTTIVIAHRLSTLANMDRILVFNEGKVIQDGKHSELIEKEGHYSKMWNMQAGGFLPEDE